MTTTALSQSPLTRLGAWAFDLALGDRRGRYLMISGAALAVDLGVFMVGYRSLGATPVAASVAGYMTGLALHWMLSTRFVFAGQTAGGGLARWRQKLLFVGSALVGLLVTAAVVAAGTGFGLDPRAAKIVAVAASFTATWVLRSRIVFR
ncbi:GtrA family protein [Novosphingobium tardum]|uniref:GtrA family protein n=1 Tax=Novosphingobium tardum TaxID=1538021 RepID=A0ABV8RKF8_9SPHN